jgi:hypothetical protein
MTWFWDFVKQAFTKKLLICWRQPASQSKTLPSSAPSRHRYSLDRVCVRERKRARVRAFYPPLVSPANPHYTCKTLSKLDALFSPALCGGNAATRRYWHRSCLINSVWDLFINIDIHVYSSRSIASCMRECWCRVDSNKDARRLPALKQLNPF